jgi:N-methylhydantoinase A
MDATEMNPPSRERPGSRATRVGIDVGGTFTDLVAFANGNIVTAKVRSVRDDQSLAVLAAIEASQIPPADIDVLAHGTTVATNALLERRGARTAILTTAGFRDIIEIGRQNRAKLYDLSATAPAPLVPRELRFALDERVGPEGPTRDLDSRSVESAIESVRAANVDAVAVCLLFSFAYPAHEERLRAALAAELPDVYVACSSEVLPEFREYERFATTAANAYLGPGLASYLERLDLRLRELGIERPLVMLSSGGMIDLPSAGRHASQCVVSGPAAGVVAAAWVAAESGHHDLLTFDMGGTSTDVSLVLDGDVQVTTNSVVGGVPIKHPMVDIHTVSSGGGSIAWVDTGAALRVGPVSAGGEPGPACYGLGGTEPTVTDAYLVLGYLRDGARLGGGLTLDKDRAEHAIGRLGGELELGIAETAAGIVAVAEAEMTVALRVISLERGVDPRAFTLIAFGGAGGVHACSLAEELQMEKVLVPRSAGVLSALGLAVSDLRRDYATAFFARVAELSLRGLDAGFQALERRAESDLSSPRCERFADVRYVGQSFELTVRVTEGSELPRLFTEAHLRRYGYELAGTPLELVALRVRATVPIRRPRLATDDSTPSAGSPPPSGEREAFFAPAWMRSWVFASDTLAVGHHFDGPAIVEFPDATCVVRPGWKATVDQNGALLLERERAAASR